MLTNLPTYPKRCVRFLGILHRGKRSKEKKRERLKRFLHILSFYDDEQAESISLENSSRILVHEVRVGYEVKAVPLEEPVVKGEILTDKRGRGTLQNPIVRG